MTNDHRAIFTMDDKWVQCWTAHHVETFIVFLSLPNEIQDQIWLLAIEEQGTEPLAHRLTLHARSWGWMPSSYNPKTNMSHKLGLLLNLGLLHACKGSRRALMRHWHALDPHRTPAAIPSMLQPGTGRLWTKAQPKLDLFVLEMPDLAHSSGFEVDDACDRDPWSPRCLNVALTFEWAWAAQLAEHLARNHKRHNSWEFLMDDKTELGGFARQLFHMDEWAAESLWLIDTSLAPIFGVTYKDLVRDRKVFVDKSQRYVEVEAGDMGIRWINMITLSGCALKPLENIHDFLGTLHELVNFYIQPELRSDVCINSDHYLKDDPDFSGLTPKVLATLPGGL